MSLRRNGSNQLFSCFRKSTSPPPSPTRLQRTRQETTSGLAKIDHQTSHHDRAHFIQRRRSKYADARLDTGSRIAIGARAQSTSSNGEVEPTSKNPTQEAHGPRYILTLKMSSRLHEEMTALRRKYFPPERNKLEAHITLFHALRDLHTIRGDLTNISRFTSPFRLSTQQPQLRGTFILVRLGEGSIETCSLRALLREKWSMNFEMSRQDLQVSKVEPRAGRAASWEAHWTIMNKQPDKQKAEQAFDELQSEFVTKQGMAEGLSLWEYMEDGTWRHEHDWLFKGGQPQPSH